jgi:hypothetical protein
MFVFILLGWCPVSIMALAGLIWGLAGGKEYFPSGKTTRFAQTSFSCRENIPSPRPSNHCGIGLEKQIKNEQ